MIRMTFECPTTGLPLAPMTVDGWTADEPDARFAVHCPKCSEKHVFARTDYVLELSSAPLATA
jgi:hypothetical protein